MATGIVSIAAADHGYHAISGWLAGVAAVLEEIRPVTIATWVIASLWIPPLVVVSRWLRAGNWWAAVFPLAMYSSATYATAVETGWRWLTAVSLAFFWISFAAWIIVAIESLL